MTSDPGLADIDQFMIKKNSKTSNIDLLFLNGYEHWQSLTNKRTGELLVTETLEGRFGGLNIIKRVLGLDETPFALERSFKATTKLRHELPTDVEKESIHLEELSLLVKIFMLRYEKHYKILTLTSDNF